MEITSDKKYYLKHREKRKVSSKVYFDRIRVAVLNVLGGECIKCGFTDPRALQVDHINGSGHKDRKAIKGVFYTTVIQSVLNKEVKYQLLCANCNWIKRYENKEHK